MFPLFLLYLIFVIIRPHEYVAALAGLEMPGYVLGLAFVFWLLQGNKTLTTPQHLLVPVFIAAAALSRAAMGWFGGAIEALRELAPLAMFFLIAARVAEEPAKLVRVLQVLCLSTFVLAGHGVDQWLHNGVGWTGQPWNTISGGNRIQYIGVFADPNDLAMLFVVCVPLCLNFAAGSGKRGRLFWAAGTTLLIVGIYLTNSRGGLLVVVVEAALWSALRFGMVATGIVAALGLPAVFAATRLAGIDTGEESAAGRVDAWYVALQLFREHPLFGVGYGLFADYNDITAHNSWLLVLAELGLTGYLTWFMLVGLSSRMLWMLQRKRPEASERTPDQSLAHALLWAAGGMLGTAFFLSRSYSILFFLMWGCAAGHYIGVRRRDPAVPALVLRSLAGRWAGLAIASIAGFFVLVRILLVAP